MPPTRKPNTADHGFAATALCQYDWSTKTVPKLPTMFVMPKSRPEGLPMVAKEGLLFGITNIGGNFGTVFVDQSY